MGNLPRVMAVGGLAATLAAGWMAMPRPGLAGPPSGAGSPAAAASADLDTFRRTVEPFLAAHCVRCHGPQKKEADLALNALGGDIVSGRGLEAWTTVAERIKAGEMPPPGEKQPDPAAAKAVTDWIDRELAKAGKSGVAPVGSMKTGNHIPHDLLFGRAPSAPLDNPARLWRIRPEIYSEAVRDMGGKGLKVAQPFALPPGEGFRDVAGSAGIDESTAAQLVRNAEVIVAEQLGVSGRKGAKPAKEFAPLADDAAPAPRTAVEAAIRREFDLVLHRPPTAAELTALTELYDRNVRTGGTVTGAKLTLMAVLLSPEAVFRREMGGATADAAGRRMLSPREIAFAVAYALTDRAPDAKLLEAADKGRLASREGVAAEVRRLLDDPKTERLRLLRFFREYFGYAEAVNVFKEKKPFPAHDARILVDDTDRLILHILAEDKDVFRRLLTTDLSFVAFGPAEAARKDAEKRKAKEAKDAPPPATDKPAEKPNEKPADAGGKGKGKEKKPDLGRAHHLSYGVEEPIPAARQPVRLPGGQRAGILTQPSWLVAHSGNFDNDAIRRGKWIRLRLLGGMVPEVPITVDAQLPDAPHKTLRERMEVTKQAYCWQCHKRMNPLGLAFENYDHFGRFRTTELDKPADASAVVEGSGDPTLEGSVKDSLELVRKLADSAKARQVFVRHAFRYWMGREENLGDAASLQAADKAFVDSGGSFKALVVALLTSDSFLYRTGK
jgi:mono/diheme cytochrome c family protein